MKYGSCIVLILSMCISALCGCADKTDGQISSAPAEQIGSRSEKTGQAGAHCPSGHVKRDPRWFERDFNNQLDCYLKEVRDGFSDNEYDPTLNEFKTHFKVVHTDNRTFFSYRAECFMDNGLWLHGGEIVKVGTINVKTGKRLTTADVIPPDKRDELLASVRAAVVAKIGGEENLMPSAKEVLAALPENFYVGEDGLRPGAFSLARTA